MGLPLVGGVILAGLAAYEAIEDFLIKKKVVAPPPVKLPPPGVISVPTTPVVPHVLPGGTFLFTGPTAPAATIQAAATALAAVNPADAANEQLVRNFQAAVGLAQLNGGAGWNAVTPAGTDGRYGPQAATILKEYVAHAPPPVSPRPSWWGAPGTYTNRA